MSVIRVDFGGRAARAAEQTAERAEQLYRLASALDENPATREQARAAYEEAVKFHHAKAMVNLANMYIKDGDQKAAMRLYRRAIKLDPTIAEAHYNIGWCLSAQGQNKRALRSFQRAVELDPNFADAHYNLADALFIEGQLNEAAKHWREYLRLDSGDEMWRQEARLRLQAIRRRLAPKLRAV